MTREEEIKKIASAFAIDEVKDTCNPASKRGLLYAGFVSGAEWADAHPHWISVDKGLPTNSDDVLVCNSYGYMRVSYYHKVLGRWSNCDTYFTPTHWTLLPLLPKKGD